MSAISSIRFMAPYNLCIRGISANGFISKRVTIAGSSG